MTAAPQTLDPLALPLFGERLIEASAGTGKTFTIGALYLRLLLGLGQASAFPRPLTVEEILVVTFTEAATEELRGRIRSNIHTLRIACVRGHSDDPLMASLLAQIGDHADAAAQLLAAERQMDEAAIYTIHGFCQRMLTHNAFESGILFEQTLVQDELPLRRQACADFWRRHCYPLPLAIARVVSQEWSGPEALLADLAGFLHGEAPALRQPPPADETVLMRHAQIVARIDAVKSHWQAAAGEIEVLIVASGVDKRSYSARYLPNWLGKVSEWAGLETQDYQLPKELEKFRQSVLLDKTKKGEAPRHALFTAIDALFDEPLTLRDLIMARALSEIRTSIQQEKRQRAELGFDDLLSRLDAALQGRGGAALAQAIRQRYPVAMIDEFQDTDPQQYRIFQTLYVGRPECGLLLIGDPKQAIYAFRGADIFTYMRARSEVSAHYTLETNWRSSPAMVGSVNRLFTRQENPFIFSQIPFINVAAAPKNHGLGFELDACPQPAMQFWLQQGEGVGVSDYQQTMARLCAAQIRDWLSAGQAGRAWLVNGDERRAVQASDITILVRSRAEAALVRDALSQLAIPSVYLSNRDSVFDTPEAKDLLWLLQAVLAPEQERTLRSAMATGLLGLDAPALDALNRDELAWDALVNEFDRYRTHWLARGVLPMLREIMKQRHLAENLLASPGGERRLTDVLHLGELLQEAAAQLDSEHALVRWLAQQIAQPNRQSDNQQLRLESDRHLVRVITIHKSKGLEYPLVWLPFVGNFRLQQQVLYHDRSNFQALLDLNADEDSKKWAEEERLAEDLRLLYVALTRSVYHCSIGIAPLIHGSRKKQGETDLHHSALGYLVQAGDAGDAAYLQTCLQQLAGDDIALSLVEAPDEQVWQPQQDAAVELAAKRFSRRVQDNWRVTSYTGLQQHGAGLMQELLPRLDIDAAGEQAQQAEPALTPHTFPRGAAPGTFLHSLFETLDFSQPLDESWLQEQLQQNGIDEQWLPVLAQWIQALLNTPLNDAGIMLAALAPQHKQAELQFYLPISRMLQAHDLDALAKRHDPLSANCPPLDFQQVQGMLKGFIDLVFCWQGKFYLLDYKSNWLGESSAAYTRPAMEQAMAEHRYDLQYQLYTLALHRYLRHRLPDYSYQRHFGGVIYLFLRGVDVEHPGNGIFACRPAQELVEGMDSLFGAAPAAEENES
ncbi:DNA helicase/exodeoxyribonuclease V beta subunit [Gibbsiella quercinecans]|uniref:RecBCD enzyme subunit RecB n=1 Tax=Gibbsiella quercinecans TaxID=929813 RepID=A0A250B414_9GAMM|nr:exodeoxyribonuclease V subunit beta [Gibbsiella quercinecans]ATA20835.1 exodeoxyribonuclease V subunit beta [Gibbsiella quercinecans]RLM10463.1 exodeoxyribonuclease V subunit beta [Gibbsiella quercinecans]TCT85873.1 DNA helicase/exodeoxyribonuclease V beta subunit [Gibbsiella quercinecans]